MNAARVQDFFVELILAPEAISACSTGSHARPCFWHISEGCFFIFINPRNEFKITRDAHVGSIQAKGFENITANEQCRMCRHDVSYPLKFGH